MSKSGIGDSVTDDQSDAQNKMSLNSIMYQEYRKENFTVSTDPSKLDINAIHAYLSRESYWAEDIPKQTLARSINHSLCFGLYDGELQIGCARVISDYATFAYLCDVYVLARYRRRGLSKWMIGCVMVHPDLQGLRRFSLATRDAQGLYQKFGFTPLHYPAGHMEIRNVNI
jgi:GNAT superfamily N-acetyltransferase